MFRELRAHLELQTLGLQLLQSGEPLTHPGISEFDGGDSHSAPAQSETEALSDHRTGGKPWEGRDSGSEIVREALGSAEEAWWGF